MSWGDSKENRKVSVGGQLCRSLEGDSKDALTDAWRVGEHHAAKSLEPLRELAHNVRIAGNLSRDGVLLIQ